MIKNLPLYDALTLHQATPGSYLMLSGVEGIIYTDSDIPLFAPLANETSVQSFRDRFTNAETDKFISAIKTDTNVAKLNFKLSTTDGIIDLKSDEVVSGVNYLAFIEVIASHRVSEILR